MDWVYENLDPVQPRYCIVFQRSFDRPAETVTPDPYWLAAALHGGILPTIESYQALRLVQDGFLPDGRPLVWVINGDVLHRDTQPPMTEEEAMAYLVMKDCPSCVWAHRGNARRVAIVPAETIPSDETWRLAWRLAA